MDRLLKAYRERRLILFVGAGVSMALGLPSWSQLVAHMAEELGYDAEVFRTYGSDLALAEFYRITKGRMGPMRSWMDREWHARSVSTDISTSRAHELIATSNFELIYTTNYDRWIERAFHHHKRPCSVIASVDDIATAVHGTTQIVKFHGDFDDDASIVLDETSYYERLGFESPLDIKLRSDVLGRSVLFVGYSLNDINIRYLFFRLANLWKKSSRGAVQPMSFILTSRPNPIQQAVLAQWNIQMISPEEDDPSQGLIRLLERLTQQAAG
jgi:hypothetical protein